MFNLLDLFKAKPETGPRAGALHPVPARHRPRSNSDWAKLRTPPSRRDKRMSDLTLRWVGHLPKQERPVQLCVRYPRVANRIALCWNDRTLTGRIFMSLLLDRRGRRKGFPAPVALELMRLRALFAARHDIDLKLAGRHDPALRGR